MWKWVNELWQYVWVNCDNMWKLLNCDKYVEVSELWQYVEVSELWQCVEVSELWQYVEVSELWQYVEVSELWQYVEVSELWQYVEVFHLFVNSIQFCYWILLFSSGIITDVITIVMCHASMPRHLGHIATLWIPKTIKSHYIFSFMIQHTRNEGLSEWKITPWT